MKNNLTILLFNIFLPLCLAAQNGGKEKIFWRLYSFSGEVKIIGYHQVQERKGKQIDEVQKSNSISPAILLRTKNFIWNRRFLCIDIDGEYSPAKSSEKYLVIPDQQETRNTKKIDVRLNMLPQYKISMAAYFNYGQTYSMRENLYNINSTGKNWGSSLFLRKKRIPLSIIYSGNTGDETELQTGRKFSSKQNTVEALTNTSFGKMDRHNLSASHNEFYRRDYSMFEVSNKINNLTYNNFIPFGSKKKNNFNTYISGVWQNGYETFNRYQAMENINLNLSKHLQAVTSYNYFSDHRSLNLLNQHKAGASLQHQLFESLNTQANYDYSLSKNNAFTQTLNTGSINFAYTKKIFNKHNLDLSYRYSLQIQKWNSKDEVFSILNEAVTLNDGEISLLSRQNVNVSSIQVKNSAGTIIYQLNTDYILIPQNNFIQIQRLSGGLIANNSAVSVDYTAVQPGTYQYTSNNNQLYAGLSFFKRKFSVYYRKSVQDYSNLKKTDALTLNYFDQQLYGIKLNHKFAGGGIELDNNMKNTVLPYKLIRYYLNLQGTLFERIAVNANGNFYDYKKINNEVNIHFIDMSGSATYQFSRKLLLNASVSYRKQDGEKINLNLLNYRTQIDAILEKIRVVLIYNFYNRKMFEEKIKSNAFNIQLSRRF